MEQLFIDFCLVIYFVKQLAENFSFAGSHMADETQLPAWPRLLRGWPDHGSVRPQRGLSAQPATCEWRNCNM